MDFLHTIDIALFNFLNGTISNPALDFFMPIITKQNVWGIPIALVAITGIIIGDKKTKYIMLGVIFAVGLGDHISSGILKPLVGQLRPCKELAELQLRINCGGKFGFVSGHATGTMIMATWFGYHYKKWMPYFVAFALLVSFSRIYVGVHWPSDVLGGMILGIGLGRGFIYVWSRYIIPKIGG